MNRSAHCKSRCLSNICTHNLLPFSSSVLTPQHQRRLVFVKLSSLLSGFSNDDSLSKFCIPVYPTLTNLFSTSSLCSAFFMRNLNCYCFFLRWTRIFTSTITSLDHRRVAYVCRCLHDPFPHRTLLNVVARHTKWMAIGYLILLTPLFLHHHHHQHHHCHRNCLHPLAFA